MIAIIDYGVGNLFSLASSLSYLGLDSCVSSDKTVIAKAEKLILPGVGAFYDAAKLLADSGLDITIKSEVKKGKPLLGVCLGMQLLFERGLEYGNHVGLGLLKGVVSPLTLDIPDNLKIPQMGWNSLNIKTTSPLLQYTREGEYFYFVHSYYAKGCEDSLLASTEYGADVPAIVGKDNVYGCQFHPEKSGRAGLNVLRAFSEI